MNIVVPESCSHHCDISQSFIDRHHPSVRVSVCPSVDPSTHLHPTKVGARNTPDMRCSSKDGITAEQNADENDRDGKKRSSRNCYPFPSRTTTEPEKAKSQK